MKNHFDVKPRSLGYGDVIAFDVRKDRIVHSDPFAIETFPSPEVRRMEKREGFGSNDGGKSVAEGRTAQREIRPAACGLLGASQVQLELANTQVTRWYPRRRSFDDRSTSSRRNSFT